jgi:diguanylate cyclase (GGDEF)-like protein
VLKDGGAGLQETSMLRMDPASLRKALAHLQRASAEQAEWHENLLRAIFCGLACNPDDLEPSAYRLCRFGRWYYEKVPAELRQLPVFAAIGAEHEHLHGIATRLLQGVPANVPVVQANFEEFVAASARLRREIDTLKQVVEGALRDRDILTGAYGRLEMLPELRELLAGVRQSGKPCCIVFMDIDHLKHVNDTYGHQAGDGVLSGTVRFADTHLRAGDKVFRYGGDEFLITLPDADLAAGHAVITRIREGLARSAFSAGPDGAALPVTASFGLALLDPDLDIEESVDRADQALLLAKTAGRNRAINWDSSVTTSTRWRRLKVDDTAT